MTTMVPPQWWNEYYDGLSALVERFDRIEQGRFDEFESGEQLADTLSGTVEEYLARSELEEIPDGLGRTDTAVLLDQVCASLRIDFELARSLFLLADLTSDEPAGLADEDPWVAVVAVVEEVRAEFEGELVPIGGGQFDPADPGRIRFASSRITGASAGALSKLAFAFVGPPLGELTGPLVTGLGSTLVGPVIVQRLADLADQAARLVSLALQALMVAVRKLLAWIGADQRLSIGGVSGAQLADGLVKTLAEHLAEWATGRALEPAVALLLDRNRVVSWSHSIVRGLDDASRADAIDEIDAALIRLCDDVKRRQKAIGHGATTLKVGFRISTATAHVYLVPPLVAGRLPARGRLGLVQSGRSRLAAAGISARRRGRRPPDGSQRGGVVAHPAVAREIRPLDRCAMVSPWLAPSASLRSSFAAAARPTKGRHPRCGVLPCRRAFCSGPNPPPAARTR